MFLFTIMICVKKRHKFRDSQSVVTSWLFGKSKGPATGTHQTKGNERRFRFVRIRFLQTKHHADPVTRFESCQDHLTDQSATEDPKPPCSISLDFVRPLMSIYNEFFFQRKQNQICVLLLPSVSHKYFKKPPASLLKEQADRNNPERLFMMHSMSSSWFYMLL